MINLVTGPLGAGKTYYAVRKMIAALQDGKVVISNVGLEEGWERKVANRDLPMWVKPGARKRWLEHPSKAALSRYYYSDNLQELMSVRVRGKEESRAVVVLDESHDWMNARSWGQDGRGDVVKFFTRTRKLGMDVYLLAQREAMIDKQVRDLFEYHIHLRNLKRARFGPLQLPVNLFLAIWTWHSTGKRIVLKREVYPLTYQRKLYRTMDLLGVTEDDESLLWLPCPPDERLPRTPPAALAAAARAPARRTAGPALSAHQLADLQGVDPEALDPS